MGTEKAKGIRQILSEEFCPRIKFERNQEIEMWKEFRKFGKKLVRSGLNHSHFGNISVREGSSMLITRSMVMLDEIGEGDVVEVDLERSTDTEVEASAETPVHRSIYENTSALAIIHSHSPFAIIQSLFHEDAIVVKGEVGLYFISQIPVITGLPGSEELAENAARELMDNRGVIVKGHGTFAVGKSLEEAYANLSSIEEACKIKFFTDLFEKISEKTGTGVDV